ncbi:MAG: DUF1987 domain-containing protein [Bacteroidota bacterium]|nr:DUF1987 domain-containing protein [Bacteroidota bacterium]
MTKLNIKPTSYSPSVTYNKNDYCLSICGRSIQENPQAWYDDLWTKIATEITNKKVKKLYLSLEYFNTASAKQIFRLLQKFLKNTSDSRIIWAYEADDEDMKEAGEDYQAMLETEFIFDAIN